MIIFMKETRGLSEDQVKRLYRPSGLSETEIIKYSLLGKDDKDI